MDPLTIIADAAGTTGLIGDGLVRLQGLARPWSEPFQAGDAVRVELKPFGSGLALGSGAWKLGLRADLEASLLPILPADSARHAARLEQLGLASYFATAAGELLLVLDLTAQAGLKASGRGAAGVATGSLSLDTGAQVAYTRVKPYALLASAASAAQDLLRSAQLPAQIATLDPGEVLVLEYGGSVKLSGKAAFGWDMAGREAFRLGALSLGEVYRLAVAGGLEFSASLSGRHRIQLRPGSTAPWLRVTLSRASSSERAVGLELAVGITAATEGIPRSTDEFLAGLLGLKVGHWLGLLRDAQQYTSFDQLDRELDRLTKWLVSRASGAVFGPHTIDQVSAFIQQVAQAYGTADSRAAALVERYFDAGAMQLDSALDDAFRQIAQLPAWSALNGPLGAVVWEVLETVLGGRTLQHAADNTPLAAIQAEVQKVEAHVRALAGGAAAQLIAVVKRELHLDQVLAALQAADPARLREAAAEKLRGVVERLLGQALEVTGLGPTINRVHDLLAAVNGFRDHLKAQLERALDVTIHGDLALEYSRTGTADALIDFELDPRTPFGRHLLDRAGHGDFSEVLAGLQSGELRSLSGTLHRHLVRQRRLAVNLSAWRASLKYESIERVITDFRQRIACDASGQIAVATDFEMAVERDRRKNGEHAFSRLALTYLGVAAQALTVSRDDLEFLVDRIESGAATYDLKYDDTDTTPAELAQYLGFADDFGLTTTEEAARLALTPFLPTDQLGHYGKVSVRYFVSFSGDGLSYLLTPPFDEGATRRTLRGVHLSAALQGGDFHREVAWAYWSPDAEQVWRSEGVGLASRDSLGFGVAPSPVRGLPAPAGVLLHRDQLRLLVRLFLVEDSLVKALRRLATLSQAAAPQRPTEFQKLLGDLGVALREFDASDGLDDTLFVLLDQLIRQKGAASARRKASVVIEQTLGDKVRRAALVA